MKSPKSRPVDDFNGLDTAPKKGNEPPIVGLAEPGEGTSTASAAQMKKRREFEALDLARAADTIALEHRVNAWVGFGPLPRSFEALDLDAPRLPHSNRPVWRLVGEAPVVEGIPLNDAVVGPRVLSASEQERLTRVRSYLAELKCIRIGVQAGVNFGHQSAATAMMRELRELGFAGRFEVVYADHVSDRLCKLVEGFDGELKDQHVDGTRFVAESVFVVEQQKREPPVSTIGMVAACDDRTSEECRQLLNVDGCLVLQPYAWGSERSVAWKRAGGRAESETLRLPGTATYVFGAEFQDVDLSTLEKTGMGAKLPGIRAVLEAVDNGRIDLLPAYGIHRLYHPDEARVHLASAVRLAQEGQDKPAVIFVMSPKSEGIDLVDTSCVDIDDKKIEARLGKLRPGEVLMVDCGSLPQNVFHALCGRATMPIVLEGANLTNLAHLMGKPYMTVMVGLTDIPRRFLGSDDTKPDPKVSGNAQLVAASHVFSDPLPITRVRRAAEDMTRDVFLLNGVLRALRTCLPEKFCGRLQQDLESRGHSDIVSFRNALRTALSTFLAEGKTLSEIPDIRALDCQLDDADGLSMALSNCFMRCLERAHLLRPFVATHLNANNCIAAALTAMCGNAELQEPQGAKAWLQGELQEAYTQRAVKSVYDAAITQRIVLKHFPQVGKALRGKHPPGPEQLVPLLTKDVAALNAFRGDLAKHHSEQALFLPVSDLAYFVADSASMLSSTGKRLVRFRPKMAIALHDVVVGAKGAQDPSLLERLGRAVRESLCVAQDPSRQQRLADVIQAARDPDSSLSEWYWSVARTARSPESQQVVLGLDKLRQHMSDT